MELPDGEYDIEISTSLRQRIAALAAAGDHGPPPSVTYAEPDNDQHLFQLKFSQHPANLLPNPEFHIYPRKSSSAHYMIASTSTTNDKELILEGTALKAKDSEYMLVFNGESRSLKLCGLNSIIRANKPRSSKKNASELAELRAHYGEPESGAGAVADDADTQASAAAQASAATQASAAATATAKKTRAKPAKQNTATGNKWESFQSKSKPAAAASTAAATNSSSANAPAEGNAEFDDFDFDNFDQFDDELSKDTATPLANDNIVIDNNDSEGEQPLSVAPTPRVASKKLPTRSTSPIPNKQTTINDAEDLDLDSFEEEIEDELEDELEQVFDDDDDKDDVYGGGSGTAAEGKNKGSSGNKGDANGNFDAGKGGYFSDFEIEEDPISSSKKDKKKEDNSFIKAKGGPISLRDLVDGGYRNEEDLSSSEEE